VQSVPIERNGRRYVDGDSQLSVWTPAPTLLLLRVVGHGHETLATPILEEFDAVTSGNTRVHLFVDLEHMQSYDSALRTRCTEHFRENMKAFESFHVFVEGRFVAMAVAVANVALRGIITTHATRPPFARALDNQLALHRVSDFSSDVLSS
jgi:hypothetical protein